MAITIDLSNLPSHLYEVGLTLLKKSDLFDFRSNKTINILKSDIISRDRNDNVISLIIVGVSIEYILKSFLLQKGENIFKKYSKTTIDFNDGFSLFDISCSGNPQLEQLLQDEGIRRIGEISTKRFDNLIDLIDNLKMDENKKKILKKGLEKFKTQIRNRFIHLDIGVIQVSPNNFNKCYIPAFNIMLEELGDS
ncbi:MAG: hypothetical protein ABH950_04060 [Candidatus Altiarchaeota archaeon]